MRAARSADTVRTAPARASTSRGLFAGAVRHTVDHNLVDASHLHGERDDQGVQQRVGRDGLHAYRGHRVSGKVAQVGGAQQSCIGGDRSSKNMPVVFVRHVQAGDPFPVLIGGCYQGVRECLVHQGAQSHDLRGWHLVSVGEDDGRCHSVRPSSFDKRVSSAIA